MHLAPPKKKVVFQKVVVNRLKRSPRLIGTLPIIFKEIMVFPKFHYYLKQWHH